MNQRTRRRNRSVELNTLQVSSQAKIFTGFVLTLSSVYFLIPVWWLIVSSTKNNSTLFTSNGFWFGSFDLRENLTALFSKQGGVFPIWMANSVLYAGVGAVFATLFGAACGYALAKYRFRGRGILFGFILSGVLLPQALLTVPLYLLFSELSLVNTYWAVLLPAATSPFAVYLGRVYAAASVPDEILEAARIDGSSEVRTFGVVGVPMMAPALVTIFLFSFVSIWNNFFIPLIMLSNERIYPVTLGLYNWYSRVQETNYSIVITGSLLSVIPLIIGFLSLQRFWRAGLGAGSVKG